MVNVIQEIKTLFGVTTSSYDYIFIIMLCIMLLVLFCNMLGMFRSIFDFIGGKR